MPRVNWIFQEKNGKLLKGFKIKNKGKEKFFTAQHKFLMQFK